MNVMIRTTLAVVFLCAVIPANALPPDNITPVEMALIPKYCADTQGFGQGYDSPRTKYWIARMGETFWAMHHYCWALLNFNRAMRSGAMTPEVRRGTLGTVIGDIRFVTNKAPSDFILLPELWVRMGDVELLLGHPKLADEAFAKARELKADYWPAYSRWAQHLINNGKRAEAKELVKQGLEYAPTAKVLIEQYRLLGGKSSDIVPKVSPKGLLNEELPNDVPANRQELDSNAGHN